MEFTLEELQLIQRSIKHTYSNRTDLDRSEVMQALFLYERLKQHYEDLLFEQKYMR